MRLKSSLLVITSLVLTPVSVISEQTLLKPGSLVCKSYQDLVMAKEMVSTDSQFGSNAIHRMGRCELSSPYQESYIVIFDKKNAGYEIQFPNNTSKYWVLNESVKSNRIKKANKKKLIIFPASGQSANELLDDKAQCNTIAFQETGYRDDGRASNESAAFVPPPIYSYESEGVGVSAARGAAVGAIGGAIAGDAGKGAAIGAVAGAMFGGVERARRQEEEAEWQRQYQSMQNYRMQEQQMQNTASQKQYDFIYKTCLENRGYSVK
jgi:outer membrane protein with glycine zipper